MNPQMQINKAATKTYDLSIPAKQDVHVYRNGQIPHGEYSLIVVVVVLAAAVVVKMCIYLAHRNSGSLQGLKL